MSARVYLVAASVALLLLAGPGPAHAGASPPPSSAKPSSPKPPAPSNFNLAVAAIQAADAPSDGCKLKLSAEATYKPGTTTIKGVLTVTNPTDAAINVFYPPTLVIKSVVPKGANSSPAVKALMAFSSEGSLRQYRPYNGPYYGVNGFDYVMAIDEVAIPSCFAGASLLSGASKAVPIGAKKTVTCAFSADNAVIKGTDPKAVAVSVERLTTAKDAKALVAGGGSSCSVRAKLATAA